MDIFGFINSKDVTEHLKSLNYEFTLPEAAFLVYQSSDRTWKERCAAWQELIDTMPDCSMERRLNLEPIESFHRFLRDYMALQEKLLQMFYDPDGAFYTFDLLFFAGEKAWSSGSEFKDMNNHWVELGTYFANAESALAYFNKECKEVEEGRLQCVRFRKKPLLQESDLERNGEIWVEMTPDLEVVSMDIGGFGILNDEESTLHLQFDGMFFDFPTPFKRGDILIDSCGNHYYGGPFVLDTLKTWDAATLMENGFSEQSPMVKNRDETIRRLCKEADSSDMDYYGVFLDPEGKGFPTLCHDVFWSYLNLERYEGPLQGMYRVLKPISSAMMYDPEYCAPSLEPELLCSAYQLILMEQMCKWNRCWLEKDYTKEGQELAGLRESKKG